MQHQHAHPASPIPVVKAAFVQTRETYDAIVVGSGISGGWAAKELSEKGLRTLVLERGRHIEHGKDYITEHKPAYEMPFRGRGDRKLWEKDYPMQSQAGPVNEYTQHFYVKDTEHPYTTAEGKPFLWVRGYHTGGRSLMWGRQCYRLSDLDFEANAKEGVGIDWPIRYADIAPWYDYVEGFAGISGQAEGLPQLPDGNFLPPMPFTVAEQFVKDGIAQHYDDRMMTIGRAAVLSQAHQGRAACHYCGPCDRGCSPGSYFSSLSSTLPAAQATGNMTLRSNSIVHSLIYDEEKDRVTGVRVIDRETKEEMEFYGNLVFLCASAFGSTQILLNTKTPRFPNGLANSSGTLGKYIMDHHFKVGAGGEVPGFEDRYTYGNRPNGIYIPRFRNLGDAQTKTGFLRGYGYQGGGFRDSWGRGAAEEGFGVALKEKLREPGTWRFGITAFGEILPREDNYVELNPDLTDQWGLPTLRFHVTLGDNERQMREDMMTQAAEMLEAVGCKNVYPYNAPYAPGEGIHEMGTARMGRDPKTSVLNAHNQAHDVPNLFVTDGACMTSAGCQNPSITYMALTARAADYAVSEMKNGNLRV